MIDFDALVLKPCANAFGQSAQYKPKAGGQLPVTVVFDDPCLAVDVGGMVAITSSPMVGIRLAEFPVGYDPEMAQGDQIVLTASGKTYVVKAGRDDSHGWARLDLNKASA